MKRLVLLGGGHAHLFVLEALALHPDDQVSVTLVTPLPTLIYTGMLPGYVAGHYSLERCSIDLVRLAGRAHAAFIATTAVLVNPDLREVICADGTVLPYDALSFDIGSRPAINAKGAEQNALLVRPLQRFVTGWMRLHEHVKDKGLGSVSVVGGGAGGVELAFAVAHRFRRELDVQAPHVRILTNTTVPLPEFAPAVRKRLRHSVAELGIGSHTGAAVVEVGAGYIRLENGMEFESGATLWAGGADAPEIFRDSGFATDERGFLAVDGALQSTSYPGVFGAGDCATQVADPRPKAGVFAVRAGPVLAQNLRAWLAGQPLVPFKTSRRYLALISTGRKHAVGSWGPFGWEGDWAWSWKDRIDRRFVDRFTAT
jgi:selenide,water dikinase